jgi:lysylphosphatidylglycerol synthetase-like protein (DUF2156 family)
MNADKAFQILIAAMVIASMIMCFMAVSHWISSGQSPDARLHGTLQEMVKIHAEMLKNQQTQQNKHLVSEGFLVVMLGLFAIVFLIFVALLFKHKRFMAEYQYSQQYPAAELLDHQQTQQAQLAQSAQQISEAEWREYYDRYAGYADAAGYGDHPFGNNG